MNFEDPPWDTHAPSRVVAIRRWIKSSGDLRRYTKVFCLKIKQNHFSTPTRSDRFESRHKQLQTRFRSKHDSFRSKYDSHQSTIHSDQSTIHSKVRFIRGFWVAGQGTISPTRVFTAGHDQPAGTLMGGGGETCSLRFCNDPKNGLFRPQIFGKIGNIRKFSPLGMGWTGNRDENA